MGEKNRTALRISLVAIMTAVVAVFTLIIRIPSPIGGYISLCDAAVSFTAYAFGPFQEDLELLLRILSEDSLSGRLSHSSSMALKHF